MDFVCLDERFSTTRRLHRIGLASVDRFKEVRPSERSICGGLRTLGFHKSGESLPLITVITVVFNCVGSIEETILSVVSQSYENVEYVLIDGGSTDGTVEVIKKYERCIDYWVSEPDKGIYDAMNKGINLSNGEWLNFMNAKDVFAERETIQNLAAKYLCGSAKFVYSDVLLRNGPIRFGEVRRHVCDHNSLIIHHQGSVYRKSLHNHYGPYLVASGFTVSDYLFFSLVDRDEYVKSDAPIALFDMTGISSNKKSARQKIIVDYLINQMPLYECLVRLQLLYYPESLERALVTIVRLFRKAFARNQSKLTTEQDRS
jgi:glycosyltransferase involved in cell wall biosynthesis